MLFAQVAQPIRKSFHTCRVFHTAASSEGSQELVQAVNRVESAVRALPSRQYIAWDSEDTANVEEALDERVAVRSSNKIR